MVLFSPWAFGTTQPWAIGGMNAGGYVLAVFWLVKIGLRWARTGNEPEVRASGLVMALLALTISILGFVLLSAVDAEFSYFPAEWRQELHPHVEWLPHSLDRAATWRVFWNWLALAGTLWAVRDWLLGEGTSEGPIRGRRLRHLIFVLAANGALLALEGILQRFAGTPMLLWFKVTHDNPMAEAQFGPYAYRSNAAQFFNLIWLVALGLWWMSQARRRDQGQHWMLPCVMLLVVGALRASSSRPR